MRSRALLWLLLTAALPLRAQNGTAPEGGDPLAEVKAAFAAGRPIPAVRVGEEDLKDARARVERAEDGCRPRCASEVDQEYEKIENLWTVYRLVQRVAEGCEPPCRSDKNVAGYKEAIARLCKVLRQPEVAQVQAVYCHGRAPDPPCRLRPVAAAGAAGVAAVGRGQTPAPGTAAEQAEQKALQRARSGAAILNDQRAVAPGAGEAPATEGAAAAPSALNLNNPLIVEGKLPEIERLVREAQGFVALIGKPLLEISPEEWDEIAVAIPKLQADLGLIETCFDLASDPKRRAEARRDDRGAREFLTAYAGLRKQADDLRKAAQPLALETKAQKAPQLKASAEAVGAKLALYAQNGRLETLQAAMQDLDKLFENAGVAGPARAVALKSFQDLVAAGGVQVVRDAAGGQPRLVYSSQSGAASGGAKPQPPIDAGQQKSASDSSWHGLGSALDMAIELATPQLVAALDEARKAFAAERDAKTVALASAAQALLKRPGSDPALSARLEAAMKEKDPAKRAEALRGLLGEVDRVLQASLQEAFSDRLRRARQEKACKTKTGRPLEQCLAAPASDEERDAILREIKARDPEFGLYLNSRESYQLAMGEALKSSLLSEGTRLQPWEIGRYEFPPATVVEIAREDAPDKGGSYLGLSFQSGNATLFEGWRTSADQIERVIVSRKGEDEQRRVLDSKIGADGKETLTQDQLLVYKQGSLAHSETKTLGGAKIVIKDYDVSGAYAGGASVIQTVEKVPGKRGLKTTIEDWNAGTKTVTEPGGGIAISVLPTAKRKDFPIDPGNPDAGRWKAKKGKLVNGKLQLEELDMADGSAVIGKMDAQGRFLPELMISKDGVRTRGHYAVDRISGKPYEFIVTSVANPDGSGFEDVGRVRVYRAAGGAAKQYSMDMTGDRSDWGQAHLLRQSGSLKYMRDMAAEFAKASGMRSGREGPLGDWLYDRVGDGANSAPAKNLSIGKVLLVAKNPNDELFLVKQGGSERTIAAPWRQGHEFLGTKPGFVLWDLDEQGVPEAEYVSYGLRHEWSHFYNYVRDPNKGSNVEQGDYLVEYKRDATDEHKWVTDCTIYHDKKYFRSETTRSIILPCDAEKVNGRKEAYKGPPVDRADTCASPICMLMAAHDALRLDKAEKGAVETFYKSAGQIQDDLGFSNSPSLDLQLAVISNGYRGCYGEKKKCEDDALDSVYERPELLSGIDEKALEARRLKYAGEAEKMKASPADFDTFVRGVTCTKPGQKPPCVTRDERLAIIDYAYSPEHAMKEGGKVAFALGLAGQFGKETVAGLPTVVGVEALGFLSNVRFIGIVARPAAAVVSADMTGGFAVGIANNAIDLGSAVKDGRARDALSAGAHLVMDGAYVALGAKQTKEAVEKVVGKGEEAKKAEIDAKAKEEALAQERQALLKLQTETAAGAQELVAIKAPEVEPSVIVDPNYLAGDHPPTGGGGTAGATAGEGGQGKAPTAGPEVPQNLKGEYEPALELNKEAGQGLLFKSRDGKTLVKVFKLGEASTSEKAVKALESWNQRLAKEGVAVVPMKAIEVAPGQWGIKMDFVEGTSMKDFVNADWSDERGHSQEGMRRMSEAKRILDKIDQITASDPADPGHDYLTDHRGRQVSGGKIIFDNEDYANFIITKDGKVVNVDPLNMHMVMVREGLKPPVNDGQVPSTDAKPGEARAPLDVYGKTEIPEPARTEPVKTAPVPAPAATNPFTAFAARLQHLFEGVREHEPEPERGAEKEEPSTQAGPRDRQAPAATSKPLRVGRRPDAQSFEARQKFGTDALTQYHDVLVTVEPDAGDGNGKAVLAARYDPNSKAQAELIERFNKSGFEVFFDRNAALPDPAAHPRPEGTFKPPQNVRDDVPYERRVGAFEKNAVIRNDELVQQPDSGPLDGHGSVIIREAYRGTKAQKALVDRLNRAGFEVEFEKGPPADPAAEAALRKAQADRRAEFSKQVSVEPSHMDRLPSGVPPRFQAAFEAVRRLMGDRTEFFEHMQALESEVAERARTTGESPDAALDAVLGEWEARHGFKKVIDLEDRVYSEPEFLAMLRDGAMFEDPTLQDGSRFGSGHGKKTHRLQAHVVLRALEAHPERFGGIRQGSELFKELGNLDGTKLDWTGIRNAPTDVTSPRDLWYHLFDNFGNNWSSPEFLRRQHDYWPGLGDWY